MALAKARIVLRGLLEVKSNGLNNRIFPVLDTKELRLFASEIEICDLIGNEYTAVGKH